ncbi:MAG: glycoside hydrolase family 15 protein [Acidobacteria bacterium]|nr:glycoside hydrolase family 15 protein [Acidobacteriota bacterium]
MRDIPVGNGRFLVNFDDKYQLRDVYFPHVGEENHSEGFPFRFGVWVDGVFSWIFEDDWVRTIGYLPESAVTDVKLRNDRLGIEFECHDMVCSDGNIYLKHVFLRDTKGDGREVRVFFHHDFRIYENKVGDTAFYDPKSGGLIHYQKHRYFLINTEPHFDQFATGRKAFQNMQGTWRDAEDGVLSGSAIFEGSVDSTIGIHCQIEANSSCEFYYWIAAGTTHDEVSKLNGIVIDEQPQSRFGHPPDQYEHRTNLDFSSLSSEIVSLYDRSLHIIRTQIDADGAILAANDHDVTERATDHYSYVWPRDGAFVADTLARAGFHSIAANFFRFCGRIIHPEGYFLQKYNPDGTVGSGWHAYWDTRNQRPLVPIQEDETALVLWALWEFYEITHDSDFIAELYENLILRAADFIESFRDADTGLPLPSWNLWEDRRGVHTFTCSTVVAGLRGAANFAELFEDPARAEKYRKAADAVVNGMREHLYDNDLGRFMRGRLVGDNDELYIDPTIDASLYGIFYFGCFAPDDPLVATTMEAVRDQLTNPGEVGGVARFQNDGYMRQSDEFPGNSWIICTLWLAEYYLAVAKDIDGLKPAHSLLEWVTKYAFPSGVLAEQIDPRNGDPLSVSPLTWSHSSFVSTVLNYLKRYTEITNESQKSAANTPLL